MANLGICLLFLATLMFTLPSNAAEKSDNGAFTVVRGQVFTPGLAIVDAPQPFTPLGGDFLQVAIDISGNGQLKQPPDNFDPLTQIFNITVFLTSYDRNHNFTISNATGPLPPFTSVMDQEKGSTVKHINWIWPQCLVGNGQPKSPNDDRGNYNVSIHQNFRLNGSNFYTVFDLPVQITNSIPQDPSPGQNGNDPRPGPTNGFGGRVSCGLLENPLVSSSDIRTSTNLPNVQPFIGGPIAISGISGNKPVDENGQIGNSGYRSAQRYLSKIFIAIPIAFTVFVSQAV